MRLSKKNIANQQFIVLIKDFNLPKLSLRQTSIKKKISGWYEQDKEV